MSDRRLIVWENNPSKREVINKKIDVLQTGVWYLPNHKIWVTAGSDHSLYTHVIGYAMDRKDNHFDGMVLSSHKKKVTEVTEISLPKYVASCSLDGTIKLWDLSDKIKTLVMELKDNSTIRGIRGITYSFDYGGNLLSYGFETHINVWCPEVSKTKSYIGKLEGHSNTIVACKFIPSSPNCVSVDDKGNIRIWDIRTLSTIQLIASE
jgi:FOG: WD40 repeat